MDKMEYPVTVLRVCVDMLNLSENQIRGILCSVAMEKEKNFAGIQELILLVDKTLDEIGRPQASRISRSFCEEEQSYGSYSPEPKRYHTSEEIRGFKGQQFTWDIYFISRLKSSWQGFVKDDEGRMIGEFVSEMELINLFAGV